MTEKNDVQSLPANLARTMPYTAYVGVASYAVVFASKDAAKLVAGMILNELSNHAVKKVVKGTFREASWTRRPTKAMDTGIYPAHYPKKSTTSGMPSGHAQTSWFLASILLKYIWNEQGSYREPLSLILSSSFIIGLASIVTISRIELGGLLCVHVNGEITPPHTPLQVIAGSFIGIAFGLIAFSLLY